MLTRRHLTPLALALASTVFVGCSSDDDTAPPEASSPSDTPSSDAEVTATDDTEETPNETESAEPCVLEPGDTIAVTALNRRWLSVKASIGAPDHVERLDGMDQAFTDAYAYLDETCLGMVFLTFENEWILAESIARNGGVIPDAVISEVEDAGQAWYDTIPYDDVTFGQ